MQQLLQWGKTISITYFIALDIQHAVRMRRIVTWSVRLYIIFQYYLINGTIFEKKNKLLDIKCVF